MAISFQIILETPQFLVLNKPPNIPFHNNATSPGVLTLLRQELGPAANRLSPCSLTAQGESPNGDKTADRLYPVHRLDSITSGALVFAKSTNAARSLIDAFRSRLVSKYYVALSARKPSKKQGTVSGDMTKGRRGSWMLQRSAENPAITKFASGAVPGRPGLRAFLLKPETGKTHQLRVAMKSLGAPVLGDERYAAAEDAKTQERAYLHCAALRFIDPGDGRTLRQVVVPPSQGSEFLSEGFSDVFEGWFGGLESDNGVWFPETKLLRSDPAALGGSGRSVGGGEAYFDAEDWGSAFEM